jgi:hypothetical protein
VKLGLGLFRQTTLVNHVSRYMTLSLLTTPRVN